MKGSLARTGWLRFALALAVAYLLAFQGIASAVARSVDPIAAPSSHFCAPAQQQQSPEQPKTEAHPCCLAGCRHNVDHVPVVAPPSLIAWARPGLVLLVVPPIPGDDEPMRAVEAGLRPPTRAPPLR